ncbi:MAG TPA: oxaloacetate decarboxylase [Paludibacteraceae bacterium]|jgi:pyruvate carboxylase subunit B|nr:MAG: Methylmalonyl-CoA carboxyltransferase 5S subunit [Bacteroidetes bacterium ADurb.Bin057]HPO47698.1 oxaloacetate decarboxylase [Paludibacteraceae bacterium]HPW95341.1 oxaloacetate decarboxylase [Paludibacteraceae bacterium]HQC04636.1 oxaloacetate decarboxylase [Paludibacteraceae bacterium]
MKKEIKFSLVYRDMWQSSGKYVPRKDQLAKIAPVIIDMGCFARVETNGGASEQVNLLYGENPNLAVRTFTKPFNEAGIQTHMLDRGLNALRMNPVPADVRELMYKVKKAQGTDITRIFCGLNDVRNIAPSIKWAKAAGMIAQATMCITYSPVHTAEYYINMAEQLIAEGAQEICLKDMAGIGRPTILGTIVKSIKTNHPDIIVQYHGHTGPGFSVASMLEVAKAGGDVLDVAMEPLSWGMVHPDVITIQAMLKEAGFQVPEINMKAYMEARRLTQSFIDDFLGYFIDPRNSQMTSLLVGCGLPGGMMGSLMADLKGVHAAINSNLKAQGKAELSEDELLVQLFDEVKYIWPKLGNPPLVTPFSQYVKNVALMNVFAMSKGQERWSMIDPNTWDMILGKAGKLPGTLAPEIVELAKSKNFEFFEGNPQDNYPNVLPKYIKEMEELGWERGQDDEELFEFAMHDKQYREFKSGEAKRRFNAELEEKMAAKFQCAGGDGIKIPDFRQLRHPNAEPVIAPVSGCVMWEFDYLEKSIKPIPGTVYKEGDFLCAIQTNGRGLEIVKALFGGKIVESVEQGTMVRKGDIIAYIEK